MFINQFLAGKYALADVSHFRSELEILGNEAILEGQYCASQQLK